MSTKTYHTPGVYYEREDAVAPRIAPLRTDVAAFVGIARRGPLDIAVRIESWRQFNASFGGFSGVGFLAYAVRAFFENGGRRCWVVRVASRDQDAGATVSAITIPTVDGRPGLRIEGTSPGTWGNALSIELNERRSAQTVTDPAGSSTTTSSVASTSGFERGSFVRLRQPPASTLRRIVAGVDHVVRELRWVDEDTDPSLSTHEPITGFSMDESIQIDALEYTLLVHESNRLVESHTQLSLVPGHERYVETVLGPLEYDSQPTSSASAPSVLARIRVLDQRDDPTVALAVPSEELVLSSGTDGLTALTTYDFIGEESSPSDSDKTRSVRLRGLRALEDIGDVSIVAVPDIHVQPVVEPSYVVPEPCIPDPCLSAIDVLPVANRAARPAAEQPPTFDEDQIYEVQSALVEQCEMLHDRVAIIDPPASIALSEENGLAEARAWRQRFETKYAALYFPWLKVVDPLRGISGTIREVPPSGHVAGQYADTDLTTGVHKAAANRSLVWAQDTTIGIEDAQHGLLNDEGINVIRPLPGRGVRIMGARSLSSDPDWVYINVRRLILMIMKACDLTTQWAVFEPNNIYTRTKLRVALTSFLSSLWQRGALTGDVAETAFFVRCDETNNPPNDRDAGRLVAEIGVAPSIPFEFVVLRIGRTSDELEILETSLAGAA